MPGPRLPCVALAVAEEATRPKMSLPVVHKTAIHRSPSLFVTSFVTELDGFTFKVSFVSRNSNSGRLVLGSRPAVTLTSASCDSDLSRL